jgi:hypothetical protein
MTDHAQAAHEVAAVRKAKLRELDSLAAVLARASGKVAGTRPPGPAGACGGCPDGNPRGQDG